MNEHVTLKGRPAVKVDLSGAFIRRFDLSRTNLEGANLSGADCTNAIFREANLKDAVLDGTILRGADLTGVKHLTREQISKAVLDETTKLPDYLR
jgi:uncharacterized protein YjbI with pentapeptide repeats